MTPREVIAEELDRFTTSPATRANGVLAALRAAGYIIILPAAEVDAGRARRQSSEDGR